MKVLKFMATWCGPCSALTQVINGIQDLPVEVESVDIDSQTDLAVQYRVRGVPTCVLLDDDGNEVKRKTGTMTSGEFLAFVTT